MSDRPEVVADRDISRLHRVYTEAEHRAQAARKALTEARKMLSHYEGTPNGHGLSRQIESLAPRAAQAEEDAKLAYRAYTEAEETYGGWPRFFLVTSSNGHVHSSLWCSTTYPTTQWAWLPELSGLSEAEAVADQGSILCSICFPSAPVEWTSGLSKADAAKQANRCPGGGRSVDTALPHRVGYYSGNWGTCPECAARITITKGSYKLRAHNLPKP